MEVKKNNARRAVDGVVNQSSITSSAHTRKTRSSNALGRFVTKQTSKVNKNTSFYGRVTSLFSNFIRVVKRELYKGWLLFKPLINKALIKIKSLPWKIILPMLVIVPLLMFAVFHFYLASPSRVTGAIESNYQSSQELEEEINKTSEFIERIPPYSTDIQVAETALFNLSQYVRQANINLPPKLISSYAFRKDNDVSQQVESLYLVYDSLSVSTLERTAEQASYLLNLSKQFFEQDIEQDTQSYIAFLENILNQVKELEVNETELDITTFQRVYQQILESAKQYELTLDIDNFNSQTNNISSEIYKTIYRSWYDYASSVQANLSTFRSSTESIIFSQN